MTCTNCIHKDVCYKIEHYGRDLDSNELCEHFRDSTKMIPKAPVLDYVGVEGDAKVYHCPTCHYEDGVDLEDVYGIKFDFCPCCSQAFDRSGEDGD